MEHADGDKCKIVRVYFARSNDGIFLGKKVKTQPSRSSKKPFNICKLIVV